MQENIASIVAAGKDAGGEMLTSKFALLQGQGSMSQLQMETPQNKKKEVCDWRLKANVPITGVGKNLVTSDPNISNDTLKKLIITERKYLTPEIREMFLTKSKKQIFEEVFLSCGEIGICHVSLLIKDDLDQCKADLIAGYCDDRRLPFIVGALYLDAYISTRPLLYIEHTLVDNYQEIEWEPKQIYVVPKTVMPPKKKKDFKKYYDISKVDIPELTDCPVCGSEAELMRTGQRNRYWHVCCTDPNCECRNYLGLKQRATVEEAVKEWEEYCQCAASSAVQTLLYTDKDPKRKEGE